MELFQNLSTLDVEIILEDYKPTDKLLLTFDTATSNIQLILTKEQLEKLRAAIYLTEQEAEEMYKDHQRLKTDCN